jgi:hypothetical protein
MKKIPVSTRIIADIYDVSPQWIKILTDKGVIHKIDHGTYDLVTSTRDYIKFLKNKHKPTEGEQQDPSQITIEEAKRLKAIKEVEKLDLQNAREKGELIRKDKVRDLSIKAGALLVAELNAIENDLPGQIEGAEAVLIRDRLSSRFSIMLERFREQLKQAETADPIEE